MAAIYKDGEAQFSQNAEMFFNECLAIGIEAVNRRITAASISEVTLVNTRFKQLAYIIDQIIHDTCMSYDDINGYKGEFKNDVKVCVGSFVWI